MPDFYCLFRRETKLVHVYPFQYLLHHHKLLTFLSFCVNISGLIGRRSFLSTNNSFLESFKLFYEELKPAKNTNSRIRRVRPSSATK